MLTIQRPLVRVIIQDAIENLRASLLFINAFPGPACAVTFIRDALITAASQNGPAAIPVHMRLLQDEDYMAKIVSLVSNIGHFMMTSFTQFEAACTNFSFQG